MSYHYTSLKEQSTSSDTSSDLEHTPTFSPRIPTRRPFSLLQIALLAFLSLGWVLFLLKLFQPSSVPSFARPTLTPLPPTVFETQKRIFKRDDRYIGFSNEVNHNWDGLVAGHDALWIENPETYGLPDGEIPPYNHPNMARPAPEKFYVVSGLHQLHCLNMIRVRYFLTSLNITDPTPDYSPHKWEVHVEHCFEYLRQAISCGSLFTIEGATPLVAPGEEGLASTVTGWGIEHDCYNFEALREFQIAQEGKYNATWMRK